MKTVLSSVVKLCGRNTSLYWSKKAYFSLLRSNQDSQGFAGCFFLYFSIFCIWSYYILRRPQNFAKSPPIICPMYCQSNNGLLRIYELYRNRNSGFHCQEKRNILQVNYFQIMKVLPSKVSFQIGRYFKRKIIWK